MHLGIGNASRSYNLGMTFWKGVILKRIKGEKRTTEVTKARALLELIQPLEI